VVHILYHGPQSRSADFWSADYTFAGPQVRKSALVKVHITAATLNGPKNDWGQ